MVTPPEVDAQILAAVEGGDVERASAALARHYVTVALNAVTLVDPRHNPEVIREAATAVLGPPD